MIDIDDWDSDGVRTPQSYFDALNLRYNFQMDLFASAENHLAPRYLSKKDDAFWQEWPHLSEGWCWANPPYSRGNLDKFVRRAIVEAQRGAGIVCLIPATPGTQWFQNNLLRCCDLLGGETVDRGIITGYELSMLGLGYRQKILFLRGRVPFEPPIGWPTERPWNPPATDSVVIEWKKRG